MLGLCLVWLCFVCLSQTVVIPATNGSLELNFRLDSRGASRVLDWSIKDNVGWMMHAGENYTAIAYYTQVMGWPNPPGVIRWFDLFGVSTKGDNIAIGYLGVSPTNTSDCSAFEVVWEEDYNNILQAAVISKASCQWTDLSQKPTRFPVSFPPLKGVPKRAIDTGITIVGSEVYLNKTYGWLKIQSINYTVIPITTVDCDDCGANCHTCLRSPWYELHFIYYSNEAPSIGFGIYYIYPYNKTFVQLNYTLSLPKLDTPEITFQANWFGSLNDNKPPFSYYF